MASESSDFGDEAAVVAGRSMRCSLFHWSMEKGDSRDHGTCLDGAKFSERSITGVVASYDM